MRQNPVRTNYFDAWIAFRRSDDYKTAWEAMKKQGHKQRYANNILHLAFNAGWGKRKIVQTQ